MPAATTKLFFLRPATIEQPRSNAKVKTSVMMFPRSDFKIYLKSMFVDVPISLLKADPSGYGRMFVLNDIDKCQVKDVNRLNIENLPKQWLLADTSALDARVIAVGLIAFCFCREMCVCVWCVCVYVCVNISHTHITDTSAVALIDVGVARVQKPGCRQALTR